MNNKGNIIVIGLIFLNILCILSNICTTNLKQVVILNHIDTNMEIAKIKTIQRIEKEFNKNCENFEFEENGVYVIAEYDGIDYVVSIEGNTYYEMRISFDEVFKCIGNIEYIYD